MSVYNKIKKCGIIPVVVVDNSDDALNLGKSLLKGGIDVVEVTFRTKAAEESIKILTDNLPEILVGAGTVLTIDQLERAVNSGAKFIVSPGYDDNIVKRAKELNVDIFPGVITPTEIIKALKQNLKVVKFFPASKFGGIETIKSLCGPFNDLEFLPTGGINENNLQEFFEFDKVLAVGGSWICNKKLINEGKWKEIEELSKEAREIFKRTRKVN